MKCLNQHITERVSLYNGDCCEILPDLPDASVGFSIFSPPFESLYTYSDSPRDMGNCANREEFFIQFSFLVRELLRVMQPGRIVAVHCMDLPIMKERDGYIGTRDFPGDIIRCFESVGFINHTPRVTIWKDPLIEATRTKALGLMHKQLQKDSTMCRFGSPDYILAFRKPGENKNPVTHPEGLRRYAGSNDPGHQGNRSHNIWRAYASPVWDDIQQTLTLNRDGARDEKDERHVCPLQLQTIERCLTLWSNPGDVVLSPFAGIGSELYAALVNCRKVLGIELKESYYAQAVKNCEEAERAKIEEGDDLFAKLESEDESRRGEAMAEAQEEQP